MSRTTRLGLFGVGVAAFAATVIACGTASASWQASPATVAQPTTIAAATASAEWQPSRPQRGGQFDGSNDYLTRGALTGAANGNAGTLVYTIETTTVGGSFAVVWSRTNNAGVQSLLVSGGDITLSLRDASSAGIVAVQHTPSASLLDGTPHTVHWSWDTAAQRLELAIDGAAQSLGTPTWSSTNAVGYAAATGWRVGASNTGSDKLLGCLGDVFFDTAAETRAGTSDGRAAFHDGTRAVFLGADGSLPTGSQPIVCLSRQGSDAPDDLATNRGTGGDFTVVGALGECLLQAAGGINLHTAVAGATAAATWAGIAAAINLHATLAATTGSAAWQASAGTVNSHTAIASSTAPATWTANAGTLNLHTGIGAATSSATWLGSNAGISATLSITTTTGASQWASSPATVNVHTAVECGTGAAAWQAFAAALNRHTALEVGTGSATWQASAATTGGESVDVTVPGIEVTLLGNRMHGTVEEGRAHATMASNRMHGTAGDD